MKYPRIIRIKLSKSKLRQAAKNGRFDFFTKCGVKFTDQLSREYREYSTGLSFKGKDIIFFLEKK